jgi:hypothetical protein
VPTIGIFGHGTMSFRNVADIVTDERFNLERGPLSGD